MCAKDVTLEVDDNRYPGRLNVPDESSERGVLMIPGSGHGPFGDVFLRFAREAAREGQYVARFETWPFPEDIETKTDEEYAADLAASIEFLASRGCSTITVVAKSYGGRVALQQYSDAIDRMVLWAPAILFGEHGEKPSVTAAELQEIDVPVRILQGDEDDVVSVENAASLVEHLPDGELVELPGEDHSFLRDHRRVIEETLEFLPE